MPSNRRRPQSFKSLFYLTNILCLFRPLFQRACERTATQTTFHTASDQTETVKTYRSLVSLHTISSGNSTVRSLNVPS